VPRIGVIDRSISYGNRGPFFTETRDCLTGLRNDLYGFIAGLGGRDVSIKDIQGMVQIMRKDPPDPLIWIGVKDVC
jgi:pyruvate/2-oxoacid:ferredoxin oxidoreductase alpha subunit